MIEKYNQEATEELAKHINTELLISETKILDLLERGADPDTKTEKDKYLLNLLIDGYVDKAAKELIEKYQANVGLAFGIPANYLIDSQQVERKPEVLGKGKYAEVSLGKIQDKELAIKTFSFKGKSFSKVFKDYVQEIQNFTLLAQENSPYLIQFIGISISSPHFCILIERANLGSLADFLEKNPNMLDPAKRLDLILGMTEGLNVIHRYLIHGDFKSDNVLLTNDFQVKLTDYGLSHSEHLKRNTGTPQTMAPELLKGQFNTKKSDIYALGTTICEVLIARLLDFPGYLELSQNTKFTLASFLETNRLPIPENESSFKMDLIINACWHDSPEKRPDTAELISLLNLDEMEVYQRLKTRVANPLVLACKYGKFALIKELLADHDSNLRSQEEGFTPLLAACASSLTKDKPELFALLIDSKACPFASSDQGETALDLAFRMNNEAAIGALMHLAVSQGSLKKPLMSDKTIDLAKEWVKKNQYEAQYTDIFFNGLTNFNHQLENSNIGFIKTAKSKKELYAAIQAIGFFPSARGTLNKKTTKCLAYEHFEYQLSVGYMPKAYGLREKAMELSYTEKLPRVRTKEEFLKLIDKMGFMPSSASKIYQVREGKKRINNFLDLQNSAGCNIIPEIYGLRDKAIELLFANRTTRAELELAINKIDSFPNNLSPKEIFQIVEDYLENRSQAENIPDFWGLKAAVMEIKYLESVQKVFSLI